MSPDKLEALRKLALDERTPIDEARNAALQFVRHGGKFSTEPRPPTDDEIKSACTPERIRSVFRTDFEAVKREQKEVLSKAQTERDEAMRERDAIEGIDHILAASDDDDEFTVERLYEQVDASSVETIIKILREFTIARIAEPLFKVEGPSGNELGSYKSITEIPDEMADPHTSPTRVFRVRPDDIRVYYRRYSATK